MPNLLNILFPLSSIALFGFSGSLHCIGMCSPLVATCKPKSWKYFFSRCISYTFVGLISGFFGLIFFKKTLNLSSQAIALIVAIICLGQIYFIIYNYKTKMPSRLHKLIFKISNLSPFSYPTTMGIMTALLPCGFLYSALLMSAAFSNPILAATGMFIFSLATTPALIGSKIFFNFFFLKRPKIAKMMIIILLLGTAFFALKRGGFFSHKNFENTIMCHGQY